MNKWPDSQKFDLNVIISLNFGTQILSLIYSPNVPCLSVSTLANASPHDPLVRLTCVSSTNVHYLAVQVM